jgi:hypothetical protein
MKSGIVQKADRCGQCQFTLYEIYRPKRIFGLVWAHSAKSLSDESSGKVELMQSDG